MRTPLRDGELRSEPIAQPSTGVTRREGASRPLASRECACQTALPFGRAILVTSQIDIAGRASTHPITDILRTLLANGIIAGLTVLTGVLQARLLGPGGRGELAAIQAWPTVIAGAAMFGVQDAIVYFGARDSAQTPRYAVSGTALLLLLSVPVMGVAWIAMPSLMPNVTPTVLRASRLYVLLVVVFAVQGLPIFLLRALHSTRAWNVLRVAPYILWLALLTVARFTGTTPATLALSYLACSGLLAAALIFAIRGRLAGNWKPSWPTAWRMFRYGLPMAAAAIPQIANQRIDQLVLVAFVDFRNLGLYAVAASWSSAAGLASSAISAIAFPRISATKDPAAQGALLRRFVGAAAAVAIGTAALLSVLATWLIPVIFGPDFGPAVPLAQVLLVAATFRSVGEALQSALKGLGSTAGVMWGELAGTLVTLVALWMMVPSTGVRGAAWAASAGAGVTCLSGWLAISRVRGRSSLRAVDSAAG